jgi:hypothetical protein
MGRALRLHPLKTIANIILPFSSNDEGVNINKFLKILALNDTRIRKSYESKNNGGYISIIKIKDDDDDDNDDEEDNKDIEFRYEIIYDSMGILKNGNDIWINKLEWVKKYIDENKKRPSINDKHVKKYGFWIKTQVKNYQKKNEIMSNETIRKSWKDFINDDKYEKYFSNEKLWKLKLEWVKKYIDENKKRPSNSDKNKDVKTHAYWICDQLKNYKKKKKIISALNIRKLWEDFINDDKYKIYFLSNEELWKLNLEWVKKYIDENKKKPIQHDKKTKYGEWLSTQVQNYKKKKYIMLDENIKKLWENFINDEKYKIYFLFNEENWKLKLEWVKKYINKNKKRPTIYDKNKNVKTHAIWISHQQQNYKNKIMLDENIRKLWEDFINDDKYKEYFISNEEVWKLKLEWVKKYINENKKRPSTKNKNNDVKIYGSWVNNQLTNYQKKEQIMLDDNIRKLWEDFINDNKYKEYFLSNEEEWKLKLEWVKKYIDENKKRPSKSDKNEDIKTYGNWIGSQLQKYKKKEHIMSNETIRKLWEDFINDDKYKEYF